MKYITAFTADDIRSNFDYNPYTHKPTIDNLKDDMIDIFKGNLLLNEFTHNYCSSVSFRDAVVMELCKHFLEPFLNRLNNGGINELLKEYFVLEQQCAHSDEYRLQIKPELRTTYIKPTLNILGGIFNNVEVCNRFDGQVLIDYSNFLNDMIERGHDKELICSAIREFNDTLKQVDHKPMDVCW